MTNLTRRPFSATSKNLLCRASGRCCVSSPQETVSKSATICTLLSSFFIHFRYAGQPRHALRQRAKKPGNVSRLDYVCSSFCPNECPQHISRSRQLWPFFAEIDVLRDSITVTASFILHRERRSGRARALQESVFFSHLVCAVTSFKNSACSAAFVTKILRPTDTPEKNTLFAWNLSATIGHIDSQITNFRNKHYRLNVSGWWNRRYLIRQTLAEECIFRDIGVNTACKRYLFVPLSIRCMSHVARFGTSICGSESWNTHSFADFLNTTKFEICNYEYSRYAMKWDFSAAFSVD